MRKRYPSDLTDEQWRRIEHLFEAGRRGRPRQVPARDVVNAVLYVMKNGCAWRALPHDFPRWQTVFVQRQRWTSAGLLIAAFKHLAAGRQPSVGIIDSTFIESAYGGRGTAPNGYKRAGGNGVHILIDKHGHPLAFAVLPGNLQAAAGARQLIPAAKRHYATLKLVLGDKAYRQRPLASEIAVLGVQLDGDSPPLPKGKIFHPMPPALACGAVLLLVLQMAPRRQELVFQFDRLHLRRRVAAARPHIKKRC